MILPSPGLVTDRLVLRSLSEADIDGPYAGWMLDKAVTQFLELRIAPPDRDDLLGFVTKLNLSNDNLLLGVFCRDDGRHIGNIRLGPINRHHAHANIGILLGDRGSWGLGFASEAIGSIASYAFRELGTAKLSAGLYAVNVGSRRAFEKAGFAVEATRYAHVVLDGTRIDVIEMARFREGLT